MASIRTVGEMQGRNEGLTVALGFLVAVAAGIAGGGFESVTTQAVLYALSSIGWVVASALMTFRHASMGEVAPAAGFLVLTIAETLLWVSGRPGSPGYDSGFAGGAMFYVPAVLLISVPVVYPILVRGFGWLASGVWSVGAIRFLTGSEFSHTEPLAIAGYTLISAFFLGVAWATVRRHLVSSTPQDASFENSLVGQPEVENTDI